ncbi:hypothetical protein [uncultured Corynebacterium sp.]|uniref:hypothetical protein n=1 Tax=uncultured Corynebacterium sp. TaxID=159447 RepID=UPI0028D82794|nr:hypothetical protein [uncultured Corynebacterium sp.]
MPTPTLTLTLPPAASPPILYPVVTRPETLTASRVPRRHERYAITNTDHTAFPLVPGDVVIAGVDASAGDGAARADTPTLGGTGVAGTHRLIVTTIIRLQPGNLVYGDAPTDLEQRAKLRAFLQRRAYSCHVGRLFFTSYWPPAFDTGTFRDFFTACPAPIHHYVHMTCRARRDTLLRDTDVEFAEWASRLLPTTSDDADGTHGVHVVLRQQDPVRLFLTLVDAHRHAYPDLAAAVTWSETAAWVLNSPDAALLRRSLRDVGLLEVLCGEAGQLLGGEQS